MRIMGTEQKDTDAVATLFSLVRESQHGILVWQYPHHTTHSYHSMILLPSLVHTRGSAQGPPV